MAGRIRSIKPELLEDEKTAGLLDREFRLFVALILLADDYGNFRANSNLLNATIFWSRPEDLQHPEWTEEGLQALENSDLVSFYEVRGQRYAHITGWEKHQRVDKPGKPRVPGPGDPGAWEAQDARVYFIRQGEDGPIKIGKARDVARRVARLQTSTPHKLIVLTTIPGDRAAEARLHARFTEHRMTGEWFRPAPELIAFIADCAHSGESPDISRENGAAAHATDLRPPTSDLRPPTSNTVVFDSAGGTPEPEPPTPSQPVLLPTEPTAPPPARVVFDAYLGAREAAGVTGPKPVLSDARKDLVRKRMDAGHTLEQLVDAARGIWLSDYHLEHGYTSFDLALRDSEKVERFAALGSDAMPPGTPQLPPAPLLPDITPQEQQANLARLATIMAQANANKGGAQGAAS